jgi:hypothetical protein
MSSHHLALVSLLATMFASAAANDLSLQQPSNHQVIQRSSREQGSVTIVGKLSERLPSGDLLIQARFLGDQQKDAAWLRVDGTVIGRELKGTLLAPAGGWWRMELRVSVDGQELARQEVPHVGVGELFVVAGQSNSANHGEEKQSPKSGLVATFDGQGWRLAEDPQPGASGDGGSFMPPLGDAIAAKEKVPVGFIACAGSARQASASGSPRVRVSPIPLPSKAASKSGPMEHGSVTEKPTKLSSQE